MSLSENFYNQFAEYRNSIKHTAIPIKKTYDEMLQFLESEGNQMENMDETKKTNYRNWKKRFIIFNLSGCPENISTATGQCRYVDFRIAPPFSANFLIWYCLQTDLEIILFL